MYILTLFYYILQKYKKNTTRLREVGGRMVYNKTNTLNMRLL